MRAPRLVRRRRASEGSAAEAKARLARMIPEKALLETLIEAALYHGYLVHHSYESRMERPGWPDLFLVRAARSAEGKPARCLLLECKSATGRITPEQQTWLDALASVPSLEVYVVRPDDLDTILALLP